MPKNVDEYISDLSETQQILAEKVRNMLISLVPAIEEKLSFKIPFYHFFGMFSYINAVPNGIDIGFCRGKDLIEAFPQLELKERAIVASIRLYTIKDIKAFELREIIVSAAIWNEEAKKKKISMVKKKRKN